MRFSFLIVICLLLSCQRVDAQPPSPTRSQAIQQFAKKWKGTGYQWGGRNPAEHGGIDCSAYARALYRTLFNVELPRVTRQQVHYGVRVQIDRKNPAKYLNPGDLLFYLKGNGLATHVLIYAGNGLVTHSASGKGVVLESIKTIYGRRVVAKRILSPS